MIPESVIVTDNINQALASFFLEFDYDKTAVIVDENTEENCLPIILDSLPEHWLVPIKSGEERKNLDTCQQIWGALTELGFSRRDLVINLGGGVIGDMGGFAASTYKRGIDFINIPTTLLSQVDASIGGKLGIDFNGFKNHIGVFREPKRVMVDPQFIKSLPERELRSGFAEVIKHGLIADANYWENVRNKDWNSQNWLEIIKHSISIKGDVVREDPTEKGLRKILNYGHTLGHAIETFYLDSDNRLLHGEAIAIGMICESYLSEKFAGLGKSAMTSITGYLINTYKPRSIDEKKFDVIIQLTKQDKKNTNGKVNYSLLKSIGHCGYDYQPADGLILDSLFYFNSLVNK